MNRRNLLSSLAVVGTGLALGAGLSTDLYATSNLELTPAESQALLDFQTNLESELAQHTDLAKSMAFKMAKPAKLISRKKIKNKTTLKIKNQQGNYIEVITKNGKSMIVVN